MKIVATFLLVLLFFKTSLAQNDVTNDLDYTEISLSDEQKDLIFDKSKTFPSNTQLSFAIIEEGAVEFYGITRHNDSIIFISNSEKVFEIGSLTKVFTSTLLADLVINGKIHLNDAVTEKLNFPNNLDNAITFENLANHTSGLPRLPPNLNLMTVDPNNPYKDYDENQLKEYLNSDLKLNQKPSKKYEYSNLGAGLLGYVVSSISGSSYEEMLQAKIFSRYGMEASTSNLKDIKVEMVPGRDATGNITSNWDLNVLAGAGGIISNVEDISKFALAQFNSDNKVLALTRKPTFKINNNMDIGLGWHIIKAQSGDQWIWHNGGTGGYSSSMALDIQNKNGIIILSNVSAFHKEMGNIDQLCFALMQTFD